MTEVGQTGEFSGTLQSPMRVLLQMGRELPYTHEALRMLRMSGVRGQGEMIERSRPGEDIVISERNFRPISEHDATVALAAYGLSRLIGLRPQETNLFVTAGFLHDASKHIEITMMGYQDMLKKGQETEEARRVLEETLTQAGAITEERPVEYFIERLKTADQMGFIRLFEEEVNINFLRRLLSQTSIPESDREKIIVIASSDGNNTYPKIAARAYLFSKDIADDPEIKEFRDEIERLKEEGKLPDITGDRAEYLGMLLYYCDTISKGNRLAFLDDRIADILARGNYAEIDEKQRDFYHGKSHFDMCRLISQTIERIVKRESVRIRTIDVGLNSNMIPKAIIESLEPNSGK